jgi:hypothetical protein
MLRIPLSICLVIATMTTRVVDAQPRIDFELVTEQGFPLTGARTWTELFRDFERTTIRVRSGRPGEQPDVENRGTDENPSYHVVGILSNRNRLKLPSSRSFTVSDRAMIARWIDELRTNGATMSSGIGAFGLTKPALLGFHERLQLPANFSTKGVRAGDVARKLVQALKIEFQVTPAAHGRFTGQHRCENELKGVSTGTALATVLQPLGLVLAPQRVASQVVLRISTDEEAEEHWPIGWPSDNSPFKTAPALFEYLTFEIGDVSLQQALDAIQKRVEVPFLVDRPSLARLEIDMSEAQVSFERKRTFYKKVLNNLLFQAHLTSDLRIDEAGNPLLWITVAGTRRAP